MLKYYFGKSKKHPYEQQHIEVIVSKVHYVRTGHIFKSYSIKQ